MLVASVDITPTDLEAVRTAGYGDHLPSPHAVDQPLEANVLGLSGGALGEPVYVVSIDSLYGGPLGEELARLLECPRGNVLVLASHTHFAPATDPELPRLGRASADYVRAAATRIAEAVARARWHEGAQVRVGTCDVPPHLFVNRRRPILGFGLRMPRLGTVVAAPQLKGTVDRTIRLFEVLNQSGDVLAIGWGASCHPVCSPDPHAISSDFPGVVRDRLRGADADLPVLFFQGCSGDVRPASVSRRPPSSLRGLVLYLLAGLRMFVPQTRSAFESWCETLAATVIDARKACGAAVDVHPRMRRVTGETVGQWERRPRLGLVDIADDLAILDINAEVVSSRAADLIRARPASVIIPATCADEVIGYWPTSRMLAEGGYEGCLSRPFFPAVDWERDDPDAMWQTMLAEVLDHVPTHVDPGRPDGRGVG